PERSPAWRVTETPAITQAAARFQPVPNTTSRIANRIDAIRARLQVVVYARSLSAGEGAILRRTSPVNALTATDTSSTSITTSEKRPYSTGPRMEAATSTAPALDRLDSPEDASALILLRLNIARRFMPTFTRR